MTDASVTETENQPDAASTESLAQYADHIALRAAWIVGAVEALAVLLLNLDRNPIPMLDDARAFGPRTVYLLIPATFVVSWIAFVLGVKAWNACAGAERQRGWKLPVVPFVLAYALLIGLVGMVALQLAEPAFPGLAPDGFQSAFVAGLSGAVLTSWIVHHLMHVNSSRLLHLAIAIVATGVYLAISRADDPKWWQISFGSVGTHGTITSAIFNTSLMFGGLLLLVWMPFFKSDFEILVRGGLSTPDLAKWVYRGMVAMGVAIFLVGMFENQVSDLRDLIHNIAAPSMGLFVILLGFGLGKLAPGLPRDVHVTSYLLSGLLALGVLFVAIGYFNTAGVTLYGAAIAFTWLSVFVNTVEHTAMELDAFPA